MLYSSFIYSVCKERRWHCTQSLCAGMCVATGDPHYVTFDGRCFSFLGDCEYMLVQEKEGLFSVTAENVPCGSTGVTCTKSVTLSIGNTAIHLLRGQPLKRSVTFSLHKIKVLERSLVFELNNSYETHKHTTQQL